MLTRSVNLFLTGREDKQDATVQYGVCTDGRWTIVVGPQQGDAIYVYGGCRMASGCCVKMTKQMDDRP